jgi:prephenate dehydrogenase
MKITIVGTGLMGCSIGLALKKLGHHIIGVDTNQENIKDAMVMGGIDSHMELHVALQSADLVALCVPVDAITQILPEVLDSIGDDTTVMDMGSTKLDICTIADEHIKRESFVAVHPMAGVEHSGPKAAHVDLYLNARVIVCDAQRSSSKSLNKVLGVLQELKMKAIFMDSDEHDRQLALVSHLPQYIAYALASMNDFEKDNNKNGNPHLCVAFSQSDG